MYEVLLIYNFAKTMTTNDEYTGHKNKGNEVRRDLLQVEKWLATTSERVVHYDTTRKWENRELRKYRIYPNLVRGKNVVYNYGNE